MLISISIFILDRIWAIELVNKALVDVGNNLFTNSLINVTIQDGSKRERSDAKVITYLLWFLNSFSTII